MTADAADVLFGDCELVTRAGQGGETTGGDTPPPGDTTPIDTPGTPPPATLALRGSKVRVGHRGRGGIPASCALAACTGTLVLKARRRTIARARYSVAAATAARVPFRLTRKGRALLRRAGRLKATASAGAATRRYTLVREATRKA